MNRDARLLKLEEADAAQLAALPTPGLTPEEYAEARRHLADEFAACGRLPTREDWAEFDPEREDAVLECYAEWLADPQGFRDNLESDELATGAALEAVAAVELVRGEGHEAEFAARGNPDWWPEHTTWSPMREFALEVVHSEWLETHRVPAPNEFRGGVWTLPASLAEADRANIGAWRGRLAEVFATCGNPRRWRRIRAHLKARVWDVLAPHYDAWQAGGWPDGVPRPAEVVTP